MRQVHETLFRAVCLCAAAMMLVLSLLCSIRLAAVNDRGCELSGVCSKQTGYEYLWHGAAALHPGTDRCDRYACRIKAGMDKDGAEYG